MRFRKTPIMKLLTAATLAFACTTTVGCATRSVFPIGNHQEKDQVFQYCGGQQWGYSKKISTDEKSPYMVVYLENDVSEKLDVITLNFAIHAKSNVDFSSPSNTLQIRIDGHDAFSGPTHLGIIKSEKQIWDRYPRGYTYRRVNNTENEWVVSKEKYDGLFGQIFLEEPFIVKIPTHPFEEIKGSSAKISYGENIDAIYIISKVVVPFGGNRSKTSEISVRIPAFELNGIVSPESQYTFHYDREHLIERMRGAHRCASLEEIFREARNKDSWIWWMYPKVSE